jgi:very-short-patch-repair endonuclease
MRSSSPLEDRFVARWQRSYPDLSFEREFSLPAWEAWATERKLLGLVSRRVRYRADFAWPAARVALEIQGGTWTLGKHSSGVGIERDCAKSFTAQADGWACLAMTGTMLKKQEQIWFPKLAALIHARAA